MPETDPCPYLSSCPAAAPGPAAAAPPPDARAAQHLLLARRRAFLVAGAGGLAGLFAPSVGALTRVVDPWPVLGAVQAQLFPSEAAAPGAREIRALDYLRTILADPEGDREEQGFILKGVDWLEDLSRQRQGASFVLLTDARREAVLREVAGTPQGEHWLATLLLHICEALLADPVYGGNPDGIGWTWLGHVPGFPRPPRPASRAYFSGGGK